MTASPAPRHAFYALLLLSLINLVNYLDRYIISAVLPDILKDFSLTNEQGGRLGTVFIWVFLLASPIGGYLGDRMPRRILVGVSLLVWSLATAASGLAGTFLALLIARAVIGVGEAGYGAVAPSIISDLYPKEERTRKLAFFYVAIPVGSALGFGLGGWLAQAYSWHVAFFAAGIPGVLLALLAFGTPEPRRGAMDAGDAEEKLPFRVGLRGISRNRAFWATTVGYTLMTFAIGGLAFWMPTFLHQERGYDLKEANFLLGAVTATAGLFGTIAGGWLGDRMDRRMPGGGLKLSALGLLGAAPLVYVAANAHGTLAICVAFFAAQFLLFLNSGPINSAIVNCVPPAFRAFAMGLNVLCIHLLGDALSPQVIGWVADRASYELAIEFNVVPVFLAGLALLVAGRWFGQHMSREQAALSAPPRPAAVG
jgi:MFS transporter, Spinster family, sphingosine-1-phosphate transporter